MTQTSQNDTSVPLPCAVSTERHRLAGGGAGRLEASLPWLSDDILKSVFRVSLTQLKILLNTQTRTPNEARDSWPRPSWRSAFTQGFTEGLCEGRAPENII